MYAKIRFDTEFISHVADVTQYNISEDLPLKDANVI